MATPTLAEIFKTANKINCNNRILLLTHNDLDGSSCAVLLKSLYKDVTIIHCTNSNMDKTIWNQIQLLLENDDIKYDHVLITDISCSEETAAIIDRYAEHHDIHLIDHHQTALNLNHHRWASICETMPQGSAFHKFYDKTQSCLSSATALLWDYLLFTESTQQLTSDEEYNREIFAQCVSAYDTYEWKRWHELSGASVINPEDCLRLNRLYYIYGAQYFEKEMSLNLQGIIFNRSSSIFSAIDDKMLGIEKSRIQRHIEDHKDNIKTITLSINGTEYDCVYCFDNKYPADMLQFMRDNYVKHLYILYNGNGISLRSIDPAVNVADIAAKLGGGGHPYAAGLSVNNELQETFIASALNADIIPTQKEA